MQTFSIPNINLAVTWLSKDGPYSNPLSYQPTAPQDYDPGRTFYYPSSITAPNLSLSLAGDILSLSNVPAAAPAAQGSGPQTPGTASPGAPAGTATPAAPGVSAGTASPTPAGTAAPTTPAAPAGTAASAAAAPVVPAGTAAPAAPATSAGASSTGSGTAAPAASAAATPAAPAAAALKDPGKGLRAPKGPVAAPAPEQPPAPRIPFREPAAQPDVQQTQSAGASSFKISYQVQPRATFEHTFDTTNWVSKQSVDYTIRYRTFEVGGSGGVTAASSILDHLADVSLGLSTDGLWRTRFDPSAIELASTDWQNQLLTDMQQDSFALRSAFQGTIHPFPAIPTLSSSNVQYNLGVRLYQLSLTGANPLNPLLVTTGPDWTTNTITQNSLASSLVFASAQSNDTLAMTLLLPPQIPSLTARLDVGAGPFKGTIQGGLSQPSTLLYQPLIVNGALDFGSNFGGSEEVQVDVANALVSKSTSVVNLGGLSGTFIEQETGVLNLLEPSTMKVGYEAGGTPMWLWQDRIKLDLTLKTHWYLNLQNYLDNLFDFNLGINLTIFKFLDLTFSSVSTNSKTYRYIPSLAAAEGETWVNPLSDLLASFDFFDTRTSALNDRVRSAFKINTLAVKAVQHFPDWDLSFQYQGSLQLRTDPADNVLKYMWTPSFAIQVQWNAVSEVKSNIHGDYTGTYLR